MLKLFYIYIAISAGWLLRQADASEFSSKIKIVIYENKQSAYIRITRDSPKVTSIRHLNISSADLHELKEFINGKAKSVRLDWVIDPQFPSRDHIFVEKRNGDIHFSYKTQNKSVEIVLNPFETKLLLSELNRLK